eukprot:COSAG02_NODE_531_length_20680_cov_851.251834_6_plen_1015_part_00
MTLLVALLGTLMQAAAFAGVQVMAAGIYCDLEVTSLAGTWKDPRHAQTWALRENQPAMTFSVKGPWPGTPTGTLLKNGSVSLTFSPTNTATGFVSTGCDSIVWTDAPDKKAGNTWCKVGSKACTTGPPPAPPPGQPPFINYPSLSGGAFSGAPALASPDPLVTYRWDDATIAEQSFQQYRRRPVRILTEPVPPAFSGASTLLRDSSVVGAMAVAAAGSIAFDFGTECAGWLEFDSADLGAQLGSTVSIALSSSEYTLPQYTTPTGENNGGNCTKDARAVPSIPGRYQLAVNNELYEGLRYGWLHAQSLGSRAFKFTVTNFTAVCQVIPMNYADHAFEARGLPAAIDDEPGAGALSLEEVWYSAVYTTRVATIRYAGAAGFGSILMDRGDRISWTGDAHLAQKAALAAFGGKFGSQIVQRNTDRTKGTDNGIISYDMYFVLSAVDYFLHSDDAASLNSWVPLIEKKFATSLAFWTKPKVQNFCGSDSRIGADFEHSPPSEAEKERYYKMLSIQTARDYARAVDLCGAACSPSAHTAASSLAQILTGYFEQERKFITTACNNSYTECYGMHAATNAVLTGLTTPAEEQQIYDSLLSDPAHICSFSPFNTYFILEAISRLRLDGGRQTSMRAALALVRRCFHGMNRLGATTYWETFSPEWNDLFSVGAPTPNSQTGYMSHCHPWASGAAPWLTHHVLGLQPQSSGWKNFSATPFLDPAAPNLLSSVRGVQTLKDDTEIRASFACNGTSSLEVPTGAMCKLVALPLCGAKARSLHVDGTQVTPLEYGDDALLVRNLRPGSHRFSIAFAVDDAVTADNLPRAVPTVESTYRDRFIGADFNSGGDWRNNFGSEGHLFWSYQASSVDNQQLPAYVTGVHVNTPYTGVKGKASKPNFVNCSSDRRALEPPTGRATADCRALGGIIGGTVATIDIAGSGKHNISLYVVDFDRQGRRTAFELREYDNLQLAAPTQYVSNLTEGVYLTWEMQLPSRLRLMQVAGPLPNNNAMLLWSGLLFGDAHR